MPEFGAVRAQLTEPAETLGWAKQDLVVRLIPFALVCAAVDVIWRPPWLGLGPGRLGLQLIFGLAGLPVMFAAATAIQLAVSRRRGAMLVPAGGADAALQAGYYALNAPLEEAFFRGLVQGGLGALFAPWIGFVAGTASYVLYHRLGRWSWTDVAATALAGIPLGLAFWLLPGPPSLIGVTIAHVGATCGYLGPGPYLLRRLGLVGPVRTAAAAAAAGAGGDPAG